MAEIGYKGGDLPTRPPKSSPEEQRDALHGPHARFYDKPRKETRGHSDSGLTNRAAGGADDSSTQDDTPTTQG